LIISGDGIGASAIPVIVNGKITSILVTEPGTDYTNAVANIFVDGILDTTAKFQVSTQGRYGYVRSYYFDQNNIKTVLNPTAGTIDYLEGIISLINFTPVSIDDITNAIKFTMRPSTNNFQSSRSRILTIDDTDSTSIVINVTTV
jgi:hypothetical protein